VFNFDKLNILRSIFSASVLFILSERCNITCRHCSIRAGPQRLPAASANKIQKWINNIARNSKVRVLGISGGEPFFERDALKATLASAKEVGLRTVAFTNAYWAMSKAAARSTLFEVPHIDLLEISADIFHEEFIPLSNLRYAAKAALDIGIPVWFQVNEFKYRTFARRLYVALGPEIVKQAKFTVVRLLNSGRASDNKLPDSSAYVNEPPQGGCNALNAPLVCPDGTVLACCGEESYQDTCQPLRLGHLDKDNFADLLEISQCDPLLQSLRIFGPAYLIPLAMQGSWTPGLYKKENLCDICRHILKDREVVSKLRKKLTCPLHLEKTFLAEEMLRIWGKEMDGGMTSL